MIKKEYSFLPKYVYVFMLNSNEITFNKWNF